MTTLEMRKFPENYPNWTEKFPNKEELLEKWKLDITVASHNNHLFRLQKAIILEGRHRISENTIQQTIDSFKS